MLGVQSRWGGHNRRRAFCILDMQRITFSGYLFTSCILCICLAHTNTFSSSSHLHFYLFNHLLCIHSPTNILTFVLFRVHCSAHINCHQWMDEMRSSLTHSRCLPSRRFSSSDLCFFFLLRKSNPFACCSAGRIVLGSKWPTIRKFVLSSHRSLC